MSELTLTSKEYQDLLNRLDQITHSLNDKGIGMKERWLDNSEFMQLLKVSCRTAQNYRDTNAIAFSIIGNKIYYKMSDIEDLLNRHYNKRLS